jgi:hypothetical protein
LSADLVRKAAMLVFDEATSDTERATAAKLVLHKSGKSRDELVSALIGAPDLAAIQKTHLEIMKWQQRAIYAESNVKEANIRIKHADVEIRKGNEMLAVANQAMDDNETEIAKLKEQLDRKSSIAHKVLDLMSTTTINSAIIFGVVAFCKWLW